MLFTITLLEDICEFTYKLTNGKCLYSGEKLSSNSTNENTQLSWDHIIQKTSFGPIHYFNMFPASLKMNSKKKDKDPKEFTNELFKNNENTLLSKSEWKEFFKLHEKWFYKLFPNLCILNHDMNKRILITLAI